MSKQCLLALVLMLGVGSTVLSAIDQSVLEAGAVGDGHALDTAAINRCIETVAASGGGVVRFPAGVYLSHSLHLRSHITLQLDAGATLMAAEAPPAEGDPGYDAPEPNESGDLHKYQDFGHSHWHNSLLWGEDLEDVAIVGPGLIHGRGLVRGEKYKAGSGNKAIALKNCRRVRLAGFSLLEAGHFAVLATGVDDLTIEGLRVDSNRDGFDIDCCRRVLIADCSVNTPNDDAIVLKTSYALGEKRATEDVVIERCWVGGYDLGSFLDSTRRKIQTKAPDKDGPTGRIKLGTESTGDFRRIRVSDCVFERSRGIAVESVDGGLIEDVIFERIQMKELSSSAIFVRVGARLRGPEVLKPGVIRGLVIRDVRAEGVDGRFPIIIAGVPGSPVESVLLERVQVFSTAGPSLAEVAEQPSSLVNPFFLRGTESGVTGPRDPFLVPERLSAYPEPSMFGLLPASSLYARHVKHLELRDCVFSAEAPDDRPRQVLVEVESFIFR